MAIDFHCLECLVGADLCASGGGNNVVYPVRAHECSSGDRVCGEHSTARCEKGFLAICHLFSGDGSHVHYSRDCCLTIGQAHAGHWKLVVSGSWTLMVLMALQTWEIFNFIPSTYAMGKSDRRGFLGAFVAGILGGLLLFSLRNSGLGCSARNRRKGR